MPDKLPEIEDLTQVAQSERSHVVEIELSAEVRDVLQAEADHRGATLEEYVRWKMLTAAAVVNAGGNSTSRSGTA